MEVPSSAVYVKIEKVYLSTAEKKQLTNLLESFTDLF